MKSRFVTALLILTTLLAACTTPNVETPPAEPSTPNPLDTPPPSASITITDALGRTVTLDEPPQRIAMAGRALFMIADAIYTFPNVSERIAGIGATNQGSGNFIPLIDPSVSEKITLESDAGPEQIAAVQPDVVIMKSSAAENLGAPLDALGIPVVYVDFETPEQYQDHLGILGELLDNEQRAGEVAAYYEQKTAEIESVTAGLAPEDRPRTLLLYYNDRDGAVAFSVPPLNWMQTVIIEKAGGQPVWTDTDFTGGWTKVTLEQVAAWEPEVIFLVSYFRPVDEVTDLLKADPQWQQLEAVKNGKLYGFATDIYSWDQADTRWILGLTWAATKLHPGLFADVDIVREAEDFYFQLYNMDKVAFDRDILPTFQGDLP